MALGVGLREHAAEVAAFALERGALAGARPWGNALEMLLRCWDQGDAGLGEARRYMALAHSPVPPGAPPTARKVLAHRYLQKARHLRNLR